MRWPASLASLAAGAGGALKGVFGTRVSVSSSGVVLVPSEITELAVTAQDVVVDTRRERTWHFGWFPARLEIRGRHLAKAGIDLSRVEGRLDTARRILFIRVPRCKLLSLETLEVERKWQDDWFCNRCTTADFGSALAENLRNARGQASRGEVLARADEVLAGRLRDALAPLDVAVVVELAGDARRGTGQSP